MSKILINNTASDIELEVLGLTLPANSQETINPESYLDLEDSISELTPLINSGDLSVNDGINTLSTEEAIQYLNVGTFSKGVRFLSDEEVQNGFKSKNVQDAIEETMSNGQTINCYDCGVFLTPRVFSGYNSTGGQTINASKSTIQINTLNNSSDSVAFNLSSGELEFLFSDTYTISYSVVFDDTNSSRTNTRSVLEIDTGSGFVEVVGSDVYTYERTSAADRSTGSATIALSINSGDVIRIVSNRIAGSDNTVVAEGSRLVAIPVTPASGDVLIGIDGSEVDLDLLGTIDCGEL